MNKLVTFIIKNRTIAKQNDLTNVMGKDKIIDIEKLFNASYKSKINEEGRYMGRAELLILDVKSDRIITHIRATNLSRLKGAKSKFGHLCSQNGLNAFVINGSLFKTQEELVGPKTSKKLIKERKLAV